MSSYENLLSDVLKLLVATNFIYIFLKKYWNLEILYSISKKNCFIQTNFYMCKKNLSLKFFILFK